jgi:hypothetical protein
VHHNKIDRRMAEMGQTRSCGPGGSMSGLPESGHGWAIYEPAVGERAERPYKKEPRSSRG